MIFSKTHGLVQKQTDGVKTTAGCCTREANFIASKVEMPQRQVRETPLTPPPVTVREY